MVEKLKNAYEAEADAKARKASCCSDKGCESHGNLPFDILVVGILDVDFYHCDVLLGVLLNELLDVGIHLIGGLLVRITHVAKTGAVIAHKVRNLFANTPRSDSLVFLVSLL